MHFDATSKSAWILLQLLIRNLENAKSLHICATCKVLQHLPLDLENLIFANLWAVLDITTELVRIINNNKLEKLLQT